VTASFKPNCTKRNWQKINIATAYKPPVNDLSDGRTPSNGFDATPTRGSDATPPPDGHTRMTELV